MADDKRRVVRMAEDTPLPEIDHVYHMNITQGPSTLKDPFAENGEFVKSLSGTTPNFKRKVTTELRKYHRSADGEVKSKQLDDKETITGYDAFGVVTPPHNMDGLALVYHQSPVHYAAVNAKVANIVGLGYKLVETTQTKRAMEELEGKDDKQSKARRKLDLHRDELIQQIEDFNEEETFTEILTKVWRDYEVTGNGYIEVGRKRDGTIGYVGHIPAQTIRVRRDRDGFVQISANKTQFFRNFGDSARNPIGGDTRPNELIHIKRYSPVSSYYGVPDVIAAQQAIAGNEFAARFNLEYFENKAVPRHVITLKGANLGSSAQSDLLSFFETGLKGQNHRSLFIPLPADDPVGGKVEFKIDKVESDGQDASFVNYAKNNRNEILMAHRVPIGKVSSAEGASLATSRDADKTFKEQVCSPEQRMGEKKVNRIVRELTEALEFKLNEMTLTDADTQSKIDERNVKAGIWVANEVRVRDGMPAIKGGDDRVDLNAKDKIAQAQAEERTQRERDSVRSAGSSDSSGEARQPKGDGRATK